MSRPPTPDAIRRAPKVLLHDHLDGGLRPATIVELAAECGYHSLPTSDPADLGRWFTDSADSGSLERYLQTFDKTLAVMQTAEGLTRVAAECAQDLAADGVVYAEVRFAPEQHLRGGLDLGQVVDAVLDGFAEGSRIAAQRGNGIRVRALLCAMRQAEKSAEIAELVVDLRDREVAGFDIAGPEDGFPPTQHLAAFDYLRRESAHFTIHAGEAYGLPSIWEAVARCGTERLGHGVRLVEDIAVDDDGEASLGRLAAYIRDRRIALEVAPSSNVQTGVSGSIAAHQIRLLGDLGFRVTVNTDNRLMSGVSMSSEMAALVDTFGYGWDRLESFTVDAMASAFLPFDERVTIIDSIIRPGYAALRD
jgi:adenosine deaminase